MLEQYTEFEKSDDRNPEHFRFEAFNIYLKNQKKLTDQEIGNIFKLKDQSRDHFDLYENRIIQLINSNLLNEDQLNQLSKYSEINSPPILKIYLRTLMLSKINKVGLSNELFEEIKLTKDNWLQEQIIERQDLTQEQLMWLNKFGLNKKIRNLGKQKIKNKKVNIPSNKAFKGTPNGAP